MPEQTFDQGRLPRAVRTDQANDLTGLEFKVQGPQYLQGTERLFQLSDFNHGQWGARPGWRR